ncbi:MAG: OmpA family protein [Bryobacteraceae bacterium]|nr:OmpA family protein [Bryobacteraceae bacterium]
MARKKGAAEHENHERWLVSYADFITLLFAFFVVMFASSNRDKARAQAVSESVRQALESGHLMPKIAAVLGGTVHDKGQGNAMRKGPGGDLKQLLNQQPAEPAPAHELAASMEVLAKELEAEVREGKVKLSLEPRGLVVSLVQAAYFPSGEDRIYPETYPSIEKVAAVIRKLPNQVRIEGHTDSVPIHNSRFRSNWELSAARSIRMLELLAGRFSVPRERLAIAGYADNVPVGPNDTEEGRAKNRRVDLVILTEQGLSKEPVSPSQAADPAASQQRH